jgi:hypothetical protein
MEVNSKGRVIHTGPRGGKFVMDGKRKIYKFKLSVKNDVNYGQNIKGRKIYKGSRGGMYVLEKERKIYKFKVASPKKELVRVASPKRTINIRTKEKLLKLIGNVRKRIATPIQNSVKKVTLNFKSFDTSNPTKKMDTRDSYSEFYVPYADSKLSNMMKNGTVLGVTEDTSPSQEWIDAQSKYLSSLNNYDLYTAMSYTVRSHEWIGPWLRGQKKSIYFSIPRNYTVPLYSQVMKLAEKIKDPLLTRLINARNPFDVYKDIINSLPTYIKTIAIEMYIKDLQRIIRGAPPLPKTIYVYRGLMTNMFAKKLGTRHTFGEFASAAYVPQNVYAGNSYIRLKLLKGTRVLLLQGLNHWNADGEYEILINKGAHYVIRKRYLNRYAYNRKGFFNNKLYERQIKVTDVTVYN